MLQVIALPLSLMFHAGCVTSAKPVDTTCARMLKQFLRRRTMGLWLATTCILLTSATSLLELLIYAICNYNL